MRVDLAPDERAAVLERSSFVYMKNVGHKLDAPGAPWARARGTMIRRGESGGAGELLSVEQQQRIDDYWRAELARFACDFPYDEAFGGGAGAATEGLPRATPQLVGRSRVDTS